MNSKTLNFCQVRQENDEKKYQLNLRMTSGYDKVKNPAISLIGHPFNLYGFDSAGDLLDFLSLEKGYMSFEGSKRSLKDINENVQHELQVIRDWAIENKMKDSKKFMYRTNSNLKNTYAHWIAKEYYEIYLKYDDYLQNLYRILTNGTGYTGTKRQKLVSKWRSDLIFF